MKHFLLNISLDGSSGDPLEWTVSQALRRLADTVEDSVVFDRTPVYDDDGNQIGHAIAFAVENQTNERKTA